MRTLLGAAAVLLLAGMGWLIYSHQSQPTPPSDLTAGGTPPRAPVTTPVLEPLPPRQPLAPRPNDPVTPVANPIAQPPAPSPAPIIEVPLTPPPVAQPTPPVAPPTPPVVETGRRTHVVQSGETLWSISRKYYGSGVHTEKIATASNLRGRDKIRVGQVLIIPQLAGTRAEVVEVQPEVTQPSEPVEQVQAETHEESSESNTDLNRPGAIIPQPPTLNIRTPLYQIREPGK